MSLLLALALSAAAAPAGRAISEDEAIDVVFKAVHQVYPSEALQCFSLMTEDISPHAFEIAKITSRAVGATQG